jgi:hypothetical protein
MRALKVQIQPDRSPALNLAAAIARLVNLDPSTRTSEGFDDGRYINIYFEPDDTLVLWHAIRRQLDTDSRLAQATMVVCQGENGWDDYLLLHHYDRTLILDELK